MAPLLMRKKIDTSGPSFFLRHAVVKVLSKIIRIGRALASTVADAKAEAEN